MGFTETISRKSNSTTQNGKILLCGLPFFQYQSTAEALKRAHTSFPGTR